MFLPARFVGPRACQFPTENSRAGSDSPPFSAQHGICSGLKRRQAGARQACTVAPGPETGRVILFPSATRRLARGARIRILPSPRTARGRRRYHSSLLHGGGEVKIASKSGPTGFVPAPKSRRSLFALQLGQTQALRHPRRRGWLDD